MGLLLPINLGFGWVRILCLLSASFFIGLVKVSSFSSSSDSDSGAWTTCGPIPNTFLDDLHLRCPLSISPSFPLQMDGASLEQALSSTSSKVYTAVLFYDSGSPFSSHVRSKFDKLSSMFPQISHIEVEQSLAMPSLFSRYGIRSLPALFIVNHTEMMRYYGPKDLQSLTDFYSRITGHHPVDCQGRDGSSNETINGQLVTRPWYRLSLGDLIVREPYLVLAVVFLVLRAFLVFCPEIFSRVAALWMLCKHEFMNRGIFGESTQLLGRVVHLIDVKRVWSKLKLCKTRNFHKGARNARVWASSFTSVSLGETSSRPSSSAE